MPDKVIIDNQAVPTEKTKAVFGNIKGPTPMWMTWAFRVSIVLTTAFSLWVSGTQLVSEPNKVEIMLMLKVFDAAVWGIGKLFGLKKDD